MYICLPVLYLCVSVYYGAAAALSVLLLALCIIVILGFVCQRNSKYFVVIVVVILLMNETLHNTMIHAGLYQIDGNIYLLSCSMTLNS